MQIENAGNAMANEENHSTCKFLGDIYQPLIDKLRNITKSKFLIKDCNTGIKSESQNFQSQ